MMVPVGRLVLLRTIPKAELVSAMAWLLIPATIGPVVGPPVGGFIVTYLNWRWIFGINVPIGLAGIVLVDRLHRRDPRAAAPAVRPARPRPHRISLSCLMFGLEMASRGAASLPVTAALWSSGWWPARSICVTRGAMPIRSSISADAHPHLPHLVYAGACSRIAVGAMPFLLPMMLQLGFGLSAAASGIITFACAVGSLLMRVVAQPMLRRLGFRNV